MPESIFVVWCVYNLHNNKNQYGICQMKHNVKAALLLEGTDQFFVQSLPFSQIS